MSAKSKYRTLLKKYPDEAYDLIVAVLTPEQRQTLMAQFDAAARVQGLANARAQLIAWGFDRDAEAVRAISDRIGDRAEFESGGQGVEDGAL